MGKRVVVELSTKEVEVSNVDKDMIYAAWCEEYGHSIFVTEWADSYYTTWMYADHLISMVYGPCDTIQEIVAEMLDDGLEVFEFENDEDYALWVRNQANKL